MSITTQKHDPANQLRRELVAMTPEFANALPSHIKPEKFQRVVMTVVQQDPGLLNADRRTLFASCIKCAADGLIPDGREAALVIFGGKVQYMPMLAGIQKRARNSGEISSIQAHVIYENDHFVIRRGLNETIEHEPKFPGDRGKPIGAYALAKFKDGTDPIFEVMDVAAIERVRAVSRAKGSGPWVQWWDEMARKTVFRRLSKWLPMDAETDELIRRDDEINGPMEGSGVMDGMPAAPTDEFEAASSGRIIDVDRTTIPDPEPTRAADFIAAIAEKETRAELDKLLGSPAFQQAMTTWKTTHPALFAQVDDAVADRIIAMEPAE